MIFSVLFSGFSNDLVHARKFIAERYDAENIKKSLKKVECVVKS